MVIFFNELNNRSVRLITPCEAVQLLQCSNVPIGALVLKRDDAADGTR